MASNLLKTFEKIDAQRKYAIGLANKKGFDLSENASIMELGNCIYQLDPTKPDIVPGEVWQRPSDWPDCESILLNAPNRNGLHPGYIVLMKAERDYTVFTKYSIATSTTNTVSVTDPTTLTNEYARGRQHCGKGILTSDGQWYDTTNTSWQHNWDKSKDIQTESEGPLRYFIVYVDDTKVKGWCINYYEPLELIIGDIKVTTGSTSDMNSIIIWDNNVGPNSSWDYKRNLKRVKELPISNGGNSWILSNTGMSGYYFYERTLKEVIFSNITGYTTGSSRAYMFNSSMTLETFIAPRYSNTYTYYPLTLRVIDVDQFNVGYSSEGIYGFTELPSYYNSTTVAQAMRFPYLRKVNNMTGNPKYWPYLIEDVTVTSIGSFTVSDKLHLRTMRFTAVSSTSFVYKLGPNLPKLSTLEFVKDSFKVKTFDVSEVDLNLSCLINIVDGLADVTASTITHTIILGANVDKLSQSYIDDIVNKGWVVE